MKPTPMFRPHALASALLVTTLLATGGCAKAGEQTEAANEEAMADMPGMAHSDSSPTGGPTSVTFTAQQIEHGKVSWAPITERSMRAVVELPGQLVANEDRTTRLAAPGEGRVIRVHVSPGDRVVAGDSLVTLQSPQAVMAQADVSKAESDVASRESAANYARIARDRAERLLALKAIPRQEYERAIADDDAARAALAQAGAELTRAKATAQQLGAEGPSGLMLVRAVSAGVVISRDAVPGTVVAAGAPLVSVTNPSSLWLTVSIGERDAALARAGAPVRFAVVSYPSETFVGRLQSVAGAFDPVTRSLSARALVENAGGKLRPEMYARVWLEGTQAQRVIAVPDSALQQLGGKAVAFVTQPDTGGGAKFEKREVTVGMASGGWTAILSGVRRGELVVFAGAYAVRAEFARATMPKMEMH